VLAPNAILRWWKNLPQLPRTLDETLWISIAFELWAQKFLDRSGDARSLQAA
jgi:hypothetical protein